MDSWPSDHRARQTSSAQKKGKTKEVAWHYPRIDQGSVNALSLLENDCHLEWTSIVRHNIGNRLVPSSNLVKVFPDTRPSPLNLPGISAKQRAEQGAHFLRTHFPDVDVASELIREELEVDTRTTRALHSYDPLLGNLLETVCCHWGSTNLSKAFLLFPTGETNRDLNASPLIHSKRRGIVFQPTAKSSRAFETPIQQIIAASPSGDKSNQFSHIGIRTMSSTTFLEIKAKMTGSSSAPSAELTYFSSVSRSDLGDKPAVDVKLLAGSPKAVLVNGCGVVYNCTFGGGGTMLHRCTPASTDIPDNDFWRVSLTEDVNSCLLASHKSISLLDFRSNGRSLDLFSLTRPGEMLTALENKQIDRLIRAVSTTEILWFDDRFPGVPLLGYSHGRQFDRSLATHTRFFPFPLTLLSSRKNGLLSIYNVSRGRENGLIHMSGAPYCLPTMKGCGNSFTDVVFFRHPLERSETSISCFRRSDQGSIQQLDLNAMSHSDDVPLRSVPIKWSDSVTELDAPAADFHPHVGPLGARESTEVDLSSVYDNICCAGWETSGSMGTENPDAVYEMLEKMPFFWQESFMPPEQMLTTFDIAFRSGEEPPNASRADFLTQSLLSGPRGYRAVMKGRISAKHLVGHASWYHDIVPTLKHFLPDISEQPSDVFDALETYSYVSGEERSPQSLHRETEGRKQLALDLTLSTSVFSAKPFLQSDDTNLDALDTMSRATEAMSLGGEPPAIQFGYLRPLQRDAMEGSSDSLEERSIVSPLGVRLLLKEWELGSSPQEFTYVDPYNNAVQAISSVRRTTKAHSLPSMGTGRNPLPNQSQRPPPIFTATSLAPPPIQAHMERRIGLGGLSQGNIVSAKRGIRPAASQGFPVDTDIESSSQDFMISTQVLPGPYGGRLAAGKRRPVKKHAGGF